MLLADVAQKRETLWVNVEDRFLAVIAATDARLVGGSARVHEAEYKSKARFFNDLLALLLENRTGHKIARRGKRTGLSMRHDLDLIFPSDENLPLVAAGEVKIAGAPPYAGNSGSGTGGRRVSQDLDKRVREMGFTATDLKRAGAKPLYFVVFAARVADETDLIAVATKLRALGQHYADGVGLFIYRAASAKQPTLYTKVAPGKGLTIDEVLTSFSQRVARP